MKTLVLIGLVVLMPLTTLMAQSGQWESMDGPYYIYNVTGISIAGYNNQINAYAIGSDLKDAQNQYVYSYQGSSPINQWSNVNQPYRIPGVKYISASRNNGQKAYAATKEDAQEPVVKITDDGGGSWWPSSNPPTNSAFTGIAAHPNSNQICFTSSKHVDGISSIWKTINGGANWSDVTSPPSDNACIAIRIDANSGNQLANTTIYACFQDEGIWKNTQGGGIGYWTELSLPGYGTSYNGVDIASIGNNVYAASWVWEYPDPPEVPYKHYMLWHSTDGGTNWIGNEPFYDLESDPLYCLQIVDYQGEDVILAATPSRVIVYEPYRVYPYPGWSNYYFGSGDPALSACLDVAHPEFGAYVGSKCLLVRCETDEMTYFINTVKGTNLSNVVSLDCIERSMDPGRVEYSPLKTISKAGGYVHSLYVDQPQNTDWIQEKILTPNIGPFNIEGKEIKCFIAGRDQYGMNIYRWLAFGQKVEQGNTYLYLVNSDVPIDNGIYNPSAYFTLGGPHYLYVGYDIPVVGGKQGNDNWVWSASHDTPELGFMNNFGSAPPEIRDICWARNDLYPDRFFMCGQRDTDPNRTIVAIGGQYYEMDLSGGLDNPIMVTNANCITKSSEHQGVTNGLVDTLIMYLGTDNGIYKNRVNFRTATNWYPANYGIGSGVKINAITNHCHILENCTDLQPDSIVQYALGHDNTDNPYIYISADSGRSWNEIGGYFRSPFHQVNDLVTFSDRWPDMGTLPVFLGVGTENGVYRYPYNVVSGTLSQPGINEFAWGPGLIIVNGDVTVPYGTTLTILPGTDVKFVHNFDRCASGSNHNKSELIIQGTLDCDDAGNEANPVVFESSHPYTPGAGQWYAIRADSASSVSMAYCVVKHSDYGIKAYKPSVFNIDHCDIEQNTTSGIYAQYLPSNSHIRYSRILNSGTYGIYNLLGSTLISYDTLTNSRIGVWAYGGSPIIDHCKITFTATPNNSYSGIQAGSYLFPNSSVIQASFDTIYGFNQGGIYFNQMSNQGSITDCRIISCSVAGVFLNGCSPFIGSGSSTGYTKIASNNIGIDMDKGSSPTVRRTKLYENKPKGINIRSGCWPDLGSSVDYGNNSFVRVTGGLNQYHIYNSNITTISALYNYWYPLNPSMIFNVLYSPYLNNDPLPRIAPPTRQLANLPDDLELACAYPNPFNPTTTISFNLNSPQQVSVDIYNVMGQKVRDLSNEYRQGGTVSLIWDGRDNTGQVAATGVYFCSIRTETKQQTVKLTILK